MAPAAWPPAPPPRPRSPRWCRPALTRFRLRPRWRSPREGVEALALNAFAQEELARAGAAYMEVAGIYTAVDGANASVLS